ncbi:MAG: exopolysaccharide biosynthesis protein [Anaerolineae bacterium]|nr:exopolysaccharide biosynthesis protein [Anaerolineae bacterium]
MTSVELHNPEKSLAETLTATAQSIDSEHITLRELFERIGEQGLLVFCMFLTVPFLLPVSIPGVSTVFGLLITLIGAGVALNRVPWLPARLMRTRIATAHLLPAMHKAARLFGRLDKLVRPRVLVLTHGATVNRLNGFILVLCALLLMVPIGLIPFSNTLPALAILLLAAGMLQRDGWFVLAGYATMIATAAYFAALFGAALMAGHGLQSLISTVIFFV